MRALEALSKQIEENTKNAASLQSLKKAWKRIQKQRLQKESAKKKIEREVETIKRRIEQEKEAAEKDYQVPKLPVPPPRRACPPHCLFFEIARPGLTGTRRT